MMSKHDETARTAAAPAGEEIHLPGPSGIPLLTAIAVTLVVVGTTLSFILSGIGVVLLLFCLWRWIGDTRSDISELPEPPAAGESDS